MNSQQVASVVIEAFDCGLLIPGVHAFDPAIGPRVTGLCQTMVDTASPRSPQAVARPWLDLTDHVKAHRPGADGFPVRRLLCELDAFSGENGVNRGQRHGLRHVLKELPGCSSVGFVDELGHGKLARALDPAKHRLCCSCGCPGPAERLSDPLPPPLFDLAYSGCRTDLPAMAEGRDFRVDVRRDQHLTRPRRCIPRCQSRGLPRVSGAGPILASGD